jgi:hypothetical protein
MSAVADRKAKKPSPKSGSVPPGLREIFIWLSAKDAGKKISRHPDTINRRGIPWPPEGKYGHHPDERIPYKLRFKYLVMDEGGEPEKRYFEPDLEAMLQDPPPEWEPTMDLDVVVE